MINLVSNNLKVKYKLQSMEKNMDRNLKKVGTINYKSAKYANAFMIIYSSLK